MVFNAGGEYGSKVNGGNEVVSAGWLGDFTCGAGIEQPDKAITNTAIKVIAPRLKMIIEGSRLSLIGGTALLLLAAFVDEVRDGVGAFFTFLLERGLVGAFVFGNLGFVIVFFVTVAKVSTS